MYYVATYVHMKNPELSSVAWYRSVVSHTYIPRLEPHDDLDCVALDIQQVAYQIARYRYVLCTIAELGKPDQNGS